LPSADRAQFAAPVLLLMGRNSCSLSNKEHVPECTLF
jgi:hypothetical protein